MQNDEFMKLVKERRSVRRWEATPVTDEDIEKILDASRWAMSGANGQPWEFIVIKNLETKKKMAEAFVKYNEMTWVVEQTRIEEQKHHGYVGKRPRKKVGWIDAPVVICVIGDPRAIMASTIFFRYWNYGTFDQNMANVTQLMCLATASLGLAAEWVSIHPPLGEEIKSILDIPPLFEVFTLVPIGYPAMHPRPYRRELNEMVHSEKFDMSKFRSQEDILEFIKNLRKRNVSSGGHPQA